MSASTGPVVAAGAIVVGNAVIIHNQTIASQSRVIISTGIVAGGLFLAEQVAPQAARAFAWLILLTVLLVRAEPNVPSPAESFATWWGVPAKGATAAGSAGGSVASQLAR
jgi:hypothetical protein